MTMETIRRDFDRLSAFDDGGWSHNDHYHAYLLRHLPIPCPQGLEIGCGTGTFARLLAARCDQVLALDLSPGMVRLARQRSAGFPNIEYRVEDVLGWAFPREAFDCIVSIATLHHLPLEAMLCRMKDALRPGGTLLVLDLYTSSQPGDFLLHALAIPANLFMRLLKEGLRPRPPEERRAWQEHGKHETYPRLPQVRRLCRALLPGAVVRRHLFWRYSITWRKPALLPGKASA